MAERPPYPLAKAALALLVITLAPSSSAAWEFTPGDPCVLTHTTDDVEVTLTYDPVTPLYSFSLKQAQPFPAASVFGLQFSGPLSLAIGTDRHQISDAGRRVTVEDNGFGNVLNGMQYNDAMIATIGNQLIAVSLEGAADPVAAFRACEGPDPVS